MPEPKVASKPRLTVWESFSRDFKEAIEQDNPEHQRGLIQVMIWTAWDQREEIPPDLRPWSWFQDKVDQDGDTTTQLYMTWVTLMGKWDHDRSDMRYVR